MKKIFIMFLLISPLMASVNTIKSKTFDMTCTKVPNNNDANLLSMSCTTDELPPFGTVVKLKGVSSSKIIDGTIQNVDLKNNSIILSEKVADDYVASILEGTGISSNAPVNGVGTEHTLSVDQSFSPTWTGAHTYFGVGPYVAQTFALDHAGDPSTKESNTFYTATGMAPGDLSAVNFFLVDTANSTGGQIAVNNCNMVPTGSAQVACSFSGAGVFPVVAAFGSPAAGPEQAWKETAGPTYSDSTTAFGSAGTDVQMFTADNDCIYVGNATSFFDIQVLLATPASENINAVYSYSTVAGFTTFAPNDGTLGFTRNGNINFDKDVIIAAGWAARSVNGTSKYYIRACRTANALVTPPTEDTIFTADGVQNQWDPDGKITVQNVATIGSGTNAFEGKVQLKGVVTSHTTCDANAVGLFEMFDNGSNKTTLCICERTGAGTYAWGTVSPAGAC